MFTARSPGVARWAGTAAGVYCLLYALAGAAIGMAAKVLLPALEALDRAFGEFVEMQLPPILAGLVLAAALAALNTLFAWSCAHSRILVGAGAKSAFCRALAWR